MKRLIQRLTGLAGLALLGSCVPAYAQVDFSVSGTIFNDLSGNGVNDSDPGLAGWTVTIFDPANVAIATSTTPDSTGQYQMLHVPVITPGPYRIALSAQPGWVSTLPVTGEYDINNPSGDFTLDFGVFQTVSVSGNIYNDLSNDGSRQAGEPPLGGWTAEVRDGSSAVVGSAIADAAGNYTITGIGPGSFTLDNVVMPGWVVTQPTSPTFYSFTTSSGVNVVGGVFGDHQSSQAVPEPGALALFGSVIVPGITLMRRRRA